jgi:hypothetical protein
MEEPKVIDITSAFVGITTPLPEILNQIQSLGWEINSLNFQKNTFIIKINAL